MEQLESMADTYGPGQTLQLGERRPRFTAPAIHRPRASPPGRRAMAGGRPGGQGWRSGRHSGRAAGTAAERQAHGQSGSRGRAPNLSVSANALDWSTTNETDCGNGEASSREINI